MCIGEFYPTFNIYFLISISRYNTPGIMYGMPSFPQMRYKRDIVFGDLEMLGKALTFTLPPH